MGVNRVRSIDLTGGLYTEYGTMDQNAAKRQRLDFDREGNNLTPTPNLPSYIENPEILLGSALSDPFGGIRWNNNGLGSFDIADGAGSYFGGGTASFSQNYFATPRILGETNFAGGLDNYEAFG